jgi:hypothetical protein
MDSLIKGGSEEDIRRLISQFSCKDKDVEAFLKNNAIEQEKRSKSRTYLVLDDESEALLAYFTLALKILPLAGLSKSRVKALDGYSGNAAEIPALLIGQFGKDEILSQTYPGDSFMEMCLDTVRLIHKLVGGRFALIECLEIEKVISFYERHGFSVLQRDPRDKYLQLVRPFRDE